MSSVPFAKPPLDFASQFKRLSDRCLDSDKSELGELMLTTSYYRLKSYLQPFLGWAQASFSVADLKRLMQFDHDLRVLILDCLEKVEIYFRSAINEHMNAVTCDAFWYLNSDHFMNVSVHKALPACSAKLGLNWKGLQTALNASITCPIISLTFCRQTPPTEAALIRSASVMSRPFPFTMEQCSPLMPGQGVRS